jgi:hypothetical protein
MSPRLLSILLLAGCFAAGSASASVLVLQKAKKIANPNYTPPNPGGQPAPTLGAAPATSTTPAAPEPSFSKLVADVAILKTKTEAPPELQQQLQKDLGAVIQTLPKPSPESMTKLAADLSASLAHKTISTQEQAEIAKNLGLALFRAKAAPDQVPALLKVLKSTLESVEVKTTDAQTVITDLKAVIAELQGTPAKAAAK